MIKLLQKYILKVHTHSDKAASWKSLALKISRKKVKFFLLKQKHPRRQRATTVLKIRQLTKKKKSKEKKLPGPEIRIITS